MVKFLKRLLAITLAGSLVAIVAYATIMPDAPPTGFAGKGQGKGKRGGGDGSTPVPVLVAAAKVADVPVVLDGVGTARALQTVTIKPQVDGRILRIAFREGQEVKAGDLLAEIDPATYKAQLDQMIAKRALTQTQLDNARRDLERYLRIPGVVAQKTVDTQRAQAEQLEAQLKADAATIANAETMLGYTRITAPLSGRTGMRMVDEGNLVRSGDAGIVVISQIRPISVLFTLPQQQLPQVQRALARGPVPVEALDADGRTVVDSGGLQVVDNQVDPQTGTIKMKADFPNADLKLWPGQFVNVRVRVDTLPGVITVPVAAVQRGPSGPFAYVVGDDGRVLIRQLETGMLTEREAVITAGLDASSRVVTSGFARLSDGATVTIQAAPDVPSAGDTPRKGPGGKGEGHRKRGEDQTGERQRPRGGGDAAMTEPVPGKRGGAKEAVQ